MEILPEVLNGLTRVVSFLAVLYAIVIWMLAFFKRTTMLKTIGCTCNVDTIMCSVFTFVIGMMVFWTTFVVDYQHFNGYSLGTIMLGLLLCGAIILYLFDKIGDWRKNFKEI
jgi:hypothetical protein